MDPATLAGLGAPLLTEAVKSLVGLATDALRRWRERRIARAAEAETAPAAEFTSEVVPASVDIPDILAGDPEPIEYHLDRVEQLEEELRDLRRELADHADGIEDVDPADAHLVETADALRRALESVTGQRLTFKGEHRPPSGPVVDASVEVEVVRGHVAAVRARSVKAGKVRATARAGTVDKDGELVGGDFEQIG